MRPVARIRFVASRIENPNEGLEAFCMYNFAAWVMGAEELISIATNQM